MVCGLTGGGAQDDGGEVYDGKPTCYFLQIKKAARPVTLLFVKYGRPAGLVTRRAGVQHTAALQHWGRRHRALPAGRLPGWCG